MVLLVQVDEILLTCDDEADIYLIKAYITTHFVT